jgi:hypothetical protein
MQLKTIVKIKPLPSLRFLFARRYALGEKRERSIQVDKK